MNIDNHCGRAGCRCTHTENCERGWIFITYKSKDKKRINGKEIVVEKEYEGVQFCPVCDPERAYIQSTSQSTTEMHQRLRERSNYKQAENYEKQEQGKTKVL